MTLCVLQDRAQITNARQELIRKRVSCIDTAWRSYLRRIGMARGAVVGDLVKSWDVLATLRFLEGHVDKNAPILDIGCYASEVIVALHKLGYSRLSGIDLNPEMKRMSYQDSIEYETADFTHTNFSVEGSSTRLPGSFSGRRKSHEQVNNMGMHKSYTGTEVRLCA